MGYILEWGRNYRHWVREASGSLCLVKWDNWVQTLAEIATYICRKITTMLIAVTLPTCAYVAILLQQLMTTHTHAYYWRLRLLITLSCTRHTLCRCIFFVLLMTTIYSWHETCILWYHFRLGEQKRLHRICVWAEELGLGEVVGFIQGVKMAWCACSYTKAISLPLFPIGLLYALTKFNIRLGFTVTWWIKELS